MLIMIGTKRRRYDEIPLAIGQHLATEVGLACSICECETGGPIHAAYRTERTGVAAHITASLKGGPRYDATLSRMERRSGSNGIWCCATCAVAVEEDDDRYTVAELQELKAKAIARERARRAT